MVRMLHVEVPYIIIASRERDVETNHSDYSEFLLSPWKILELVGRQEQYNPERCT